MDVFERLLAAVREHSGLTNEDLAEVDAHGASAGWNGFIYYSDTSEFYARHADVVDEVLAIRARELGEYATVSALLATFRNAGLADSRAGREQLIAWFALEEAANYVVTCAEAGVTV